MEKVSQTLRRAREQRKISREEASQQSHIPLSYLMILEGERTESRQHSRLLPDPLYLIPYLQRYATFLNIDVNAAVTQFTNELQDLQERHEKAETLTQPRPRLGPSPQRSRAISISIVLASILVTLALIGQYSDLNIGASRQSEYPSPLSSSSPFGADPQSIPAPPQPPEPNAASNQAAPSVSASPSSTHPNSPITPTPLNNPQASTMLSPGTIPPTGFAPESSQTSGGASASTALVEPSEPSSDGPAHRLLIQAKETTWIRVLIEGQPPREAILRPGQSVEWTSNSTFSVTLGNAGGVTLTIDGQELPILGKSGQVLRNIRLPFSSTEQQG